MKCKPWTERVAKKGLSRGVSRAPWKRRINRELEAKKAHGGNLWSRYWCLVQPFSARAMAGQVWKKWQFIIRTRQKSGKERAHELKKNAETTILIKFAFLRGLGTGKIYGKLSKNAVFPGKFHDNKTWGFFANFIARNFVVLWEAPIKLKKNAWDTGRVSLGHPAGQTGVYRPASQGFPVNYYRKTDRKGHFCQDTGRVSQGHPAIQGFFRNLMWFFLMCLFCSLKRAEKASCGEAVFPKGRFWRVCFLLCPPKVCSQNIWKS